jgi:hypothetical protein
MLQRLECLCVISFFLLALGCAQQRPVLYPNPYLKTVGQERLQVLRAVLQGPSPVACFAQVNRIQSSVVLLTGACAKRAMSPLAGDKGDWTTCYDSRY